MSQFYCQPVFRLLTALLVFVTLDQSQVSGLLRSYRNSRTWGTGRQGKVMDEGRRSRMFRMGRQSGGENNLVSLLPECERCEGGDRRTGELESEQPVMLSCVSVCQELCAGLTGRLTRASVT